MKKSITLISILISFSFLSEGKNGFTNNKISETNAASYTGCPTSMATVDLDIGNVRARILIAGDMWWELVGTAKYEVPKGSGKNSLFMGGIWIGGTDNSGNLKVAAQTYRQSGIDFWPGPLDSTNASVTPATCIQYDRFWKITRQEVASFLNGNPASQVIQDWPGNGSGGQLHFLAPFFDANGDGIYDWQNGDYPKYEFGFQSHNINNRLNGDQTIWWVFNDAGNVHTGSGSAYSIGLEIRAQAYAFCTTDTDLSNATFYTYEINNRSSTILYNTYLGQFTDPDLGNYIDDYIGCDVGRNFGYCYNGDTLDDLPNGYGSILAAVGIDMLSGPLADFADGIDNNRNGIYDEPGEENIMNKFMYYENNASVIGNPIIAQDYYYYLTGKWKDGTVLEYGGNGHNTGGPTCDFMFPGNSDPTFYGTQFINPGFDWSESQPSPGGMPNIPGDRRFLMSAGPFTILPGGIYNFTKAAVWARRAGGISPSVAALKDADDKIQNFFNSDYNSIPTCIVNVGIQDVININHSVFPSPASDYFIIRFPKSSQKLSVKVFSADGKLIYMTKASFGSELKINSSGWNSGVYLYNIIDENNNSANGKISIMNE